MTKVEVREPHPYADPLTDPVADMIVATAEAVGLPWARFVPSGYRERMARACAWSAAEQRRDPKAAAHFERLIRSKNRSRFAPGVEQARIAAEVDAEIRDASSASNSMGSFDPIFWDLPAASYFRTGYNTLWDVTHHADLPSYGVTWAVNQVTTGASAAVQASDNSNLASGDPAATVVDNPIVTVGAWNPVSEQFFSRAPSATQVMTAQLAQELAAAKTGRLITEATANAQAITDSAASLTVPVFVADVGHAAGLSAGTSGTKAFPTHTAVDPVLGAWLLSRSDSSNRPQAPFAPSALAARNQTVNDYTAGGSGYDLLTTQLVFDSNLPQTSSEFTVLVANLDMGVWVAEDPVIVEAFPETLAGQLTVGLRVRQYVSVAVRYPKSVVAISGSAYSTSLTW